MNIIVLADSELKSIADSEKIDSLKVNGNSVSFVYLYNSCDEMKGNNMLMKVDNVLKTQALNKAKEIASSLGFEADSDIQAVCPCNLKFFVQKHGVDSVLDFQQVPLLTKNALEDLDVEYL